LHKSDPIDATEIIFFLARVNKSIFLHTERTRKAQHFIFDRNSSNVFAFKTEFESHYIVVTIA